MTVEGPLTDIDFVELKAKLADLDKVDLMIDKAIRAGIDVSVQKERARETRDKLMKMKQAFFPGQ